MEKVRLTTTLELLKRHDACVPSYKRLVQSLGGIRNFPKDQPINLLRILVSNNVEDCLWALRAVEEKGEMLVQCAKVSLLIAADIAELALEPYTTKLRLQSKIFVDAIVRLRVQASKIDLLKVMHYEEVTSSPFCAISAFARCSVFGRYESMPLHAHRFAAECVLEALYPTLEIDGRFGTNFYQKASLAYDAVSEKARNSKEYAQKEMLQDSQDYDASIASSMNSAQFHNIIKHYLLSDEEAS